MRRGRHFERWQLGGLSTASGASQKAPSPAPPSHCVRDAARRHSSPACLPHAAEDPALFASRRGRSTWPE
ncbi:hypothetical protein NDU88_007287 [Pleurodeles waltl]|uniref:Uncharacterized protein n=1 Tax=Pleurodeles waltl TaxID=8319 RepID=A0AAV7QPB2_PLEWA|nr:hypothetical protein NDU88_007287 [Pleurodeles waltl]